MKEREPRVKKREKKRKKYRQKRFIKRKVGNIISVTFEL